MLSNILKLSYKLEDYNTGLIYKVTEYTKMSEVNLSALIYRLCHDDFPQWSEQIQYLLL